MTTPERPLIETRYDQMFPTLTAAQIERVKAHGRVRQIAEGDVLFRAGDQAINFFRRVFGSQ